MNAYRRSERRWRKARERAVSPIIATILLVAITVVLAAVLPVLISGLTHGPDDTSIRRAVTAGNAVLSHPAAATIGCGAGDYRYTPTRESSTVTFSSVQFEVKASSGAVLGITRTDSFDLVEVAVGLPAYLSVTISAAMTTSFATFRGPARALRH